MQPGSCLRPSESYIMSLWQVSAPTRLARGSTVSQLAKRVKQMPPCLSQPGRRSQIVSLPQYPVSDQGHPGDVIGGGVTQVCLTRKLVPGTEEHPQHSIRYAAGTPYHDLPGFLIHFMVSQDFLPFFHLSPLTCCLQALGRGLVMQKGQ